MSQGNVGRLLVLDVSGNLSGIVTRSDLLHVLRLCIDPVWATLTAVPQIFCQNY